MLGSCFSLFAEWSPYYPTPAPNADVIGEHLIVGRHLIILNRSRRLAKCIRPFITLLR